MKMKFPSAEEDVVYRGCGGGMEEPFEAPSTAFRICRQHAELGREDPA